MRPLLSIPVLAFVMALGGFVAIPPAHAQDAGGIGMPGGMPPNPCQQVRVDSSSLTNIEAQLQLTSAQQPLWARWKQKVEAGAGSEQAICQASLPQGGGPPNVLEAEEMQIRLAGAHIAAIKASLPALRELYGALSPAQQQILSQAWPRRPGMPGGMGMPGGQSMAQPPQMP
jgi:hypothetical protein